MAYEQIVNINLGVDMNNVVSIQQYSSGQTFLFYIDNYTIPDDAQVKIYIKKPSGHEVLCTCAFEDNKVTAPVTLQMVAEVGQANGQIQIYQGGHYAYSYVFTLDVVGNEYAAMKIESSDEYRTLEELIASASYIISDVNEAEALRKQQEEARVSAENDRLDAEEIRVANENQRIINENERIANENQRKANEQARVAAENARSTAELARDGAEDSRISQEAARAAQWQQWANEIAKVADFDSRLSGVESIAEIGNPDSKYVPLNSNVITRGTYNATTGQYTTGCSMTYSASDGGLVISFI